MTLEERVKSTIRDVADFPKEGVVFKDLTTLLLDPDLTREITAYLAEPWKGKVDAVSGIESRGFWFGTLLAQHLNVPFIPLRKKGKLPGETDEVHYALEYGRATIEMHKGHVQPDWRVLIHDDLLATGGTADAAISLLDKQNAEVVGFSFLVCLAFLKGKDILMDKGKPVHCLATFQ